MKIGYLDCFSGASGDMIVGSIIDAGCDPQYIQSQIDLLDIPPVKLTTTKVKKSSLAGIAVSFQSNEDDPPHRSLSTIERIITTSALEDDVKKKSLAVFQRIGRAEAKMHNIPVEKVHFHEVGAVDAICDIVSAVAGFKNLGIEKLYSSVILLGSGMTKSAHGVIPLPSPATLEIVRGFPVRRIDSNQEMTTPTGAAIITELAEHSTAYEMEIDTVGYGAGSRDIEERPNLLRLVVGYARNVLLTDEIVVIDTNIDDTTPEQIGSLQQKLLDDGALDVYITQILMKKNRPAFLVSTICSPEKAENLSTVMLRESSTAGVRMRIESRRKLSFTFQEVTTKYGKVRIKFYSGANIRKFSPEYDDVIKAAAKANVPFSEVYNAALQAAYRIEETKK